MDALVLLSFMPWKYETRRVVTRERNKLLVGEQPVGYSKSQPYKKKVYNSVYKNI